MCLNTSVIEGEWIFNSNPTHNLLFVISLTEIKHPIVSFCIMIQNTYYNVCNQGSFEKEEFISAFPL